MTPLRPPRPASKVLFRHILDEAPEPAIRDGRRFDEPKRTGTLAGMPAPHLSGEHAPTVPARAHMAPTMRVRTPQGVQVVTIRDHDKTPPSASMPPISETPEQDALRVLRARVRELEAKAPLAVPTPSAAPALDDAAVGKLVKASVSALVRKIGLPAAFIACLGLGGGGYAMAVQKPPPPALTAEDLTKALRPIETRLDRITTATNEGLQLSKCTRRKVNQIGGALLPDPQKMGTAHKPQPYEDDCPENPRLLPEP